MKYIKRFSPRWYRVFYTYLLSYIILLLIPILFLRVVFVEQVFDLAMENVAQSNQTALERSEEQMEARLMEMIRLAVSIDKNTLLNQYYVEQDSIGYTTMNEMRKYTGMAGFSDDLLLYFSSSKRVYSGYSVTSASDPLFDDYFTPMTSEYYFETELQNLDHLRLYVHTNYVSLVYPLQQADPENYANLVFIISKENISQLINVAPDTPSIVTLLLNENRELIVSTNSDTLSTDILLQLSEKFTGNVQYPIEIDGTAYFLSVIQSDLNSWQYISLVPMKQFQQQSSLLNQQFLLATLGCSILGAIVILILMKIFYKPLETLKNTWDVHLPDGMMLTNLSQINHSLSTLFTNNDDLQKQMQQYKDTLVEQFITNIVNGFLDSNLQFEEQSRTLDISFQYSCFRVLLLLPEDANQPAEVLESIPSFLQENLRISFGIQAYSTIYRPNCPITLLLNYENLKDNIFESLAEELESQFPQQFGFSVRIVYGSQQQDILRINQSYVSAQMALHDNGISTDSGSTYLDRKTILTLEQKTQERDYEKCSQLIHDTIANLRQNNISYLYTNVVIYELMGAISKNNASIPLLKSNLQKIKTLLLSNNINLDEIEVLLLQCVSGVCQTESKPAGIAESENTAYEMLQYIEQHHTDPNFTLQEMAEHFGISYKYLSHTFKDITGFNLSDHIARRRIDTFKEKCRHSSLPYNQLILQCGYDNEASFRRRFKQLEGITPRQFYDLNHNNTPTNE